MQQQRSQYRVEINRARVSMVLWNDFVSFFLSVCDRFRRKLFVLFERKHFVVNGYCFFFQCCEHYTSEILCLFLTNISAVIISKGASTILCQKHGAVAVIRVWNTKFAGRIFVVSRYNRYFTPLLFPMAGVYSFLIYYESLIIKHECRRLFALS